jgi:hypothetical protein
VLSACPSNIAYDYAVRPSQLLKRYQFRRNIRQHPWIFLVGRYLGCRPAAAATHESHFGDFTYDAYVTSIANLTRLSYLAHAASARPPAMSIGLHRPLHSPSSGSGSMQLRNNCRVEENADVSSVEFIEGAAEGNQQHGRSVCGCQLLAGIRIRHRWSEFQ